MEPNSAKENAPKMERIAPTIQAVKTMETERPSRAISAGFRKMPVPIIVPTTMAAEAHAPRPRTSSRRFSVMAPLTNLLRIAPFSLTWRSKLRSYKGGLLRLRNQASFAEWFVVSLLATAPIIKVPRAPIMKDQAYATLVSWNRHKLVASPPILPGSPP